MTSKLLTIDSVFDSFVEDHITKKELKPVVSDSDFDLRWLKLKRGRHPRPETGLCILEAVAAYKGLPHSDMPAVVPRGVCHIVQALNDCAFNDEELTSTWRTSIPVLADFINCFDEKEIYDVMDATIASMSDWGLAEFSPDVSSLESRGLAIANWIVSNSQSGHHIGKDVYWVCTGAFQAGLGALPIN